MPSMQAATYKSFGVPSNVLSIETTDIPEPQAGEVRVKLLLSPIHNHDLYLIRGQYGYKSPLPAIGGSEAVGTIDKLGAGVSGLHIGQRLAVSSTPSAWADYFVAKTQAVTPVPNDLPDELAAQILDMPMSALLALEKLGAKRGEWIVIDGANGAVGKVITQVAASHGIRVASLVGREAARADLVALGIGDVFVVSDKDWQANLKAAIGEARVAGGIDLVGGELAGEMLHFLSPGAVFLSFGQMSGEPMRLSASDVIYKELTIKGFWGAKEVPRVTPARRTELVQELIRLGATGKLKLPVAEIFPLARAAEATAASHKKRNGKVMIAGAR